MPQVEMPTREVGRTQAFISYDSLEFVNSVDPQRQFEYHPTDRYYSPSVTFHNRALMFGIPKETGRAICEELKARGYIGLVEIKVTNPRMGVNQLRGRHVVPAKSKRA